MGGQIIERHLPPTAGSRIDIWHGAGSPAHPSKQFRSLHVSVGRSPCGHPGR
jgi:hypothetical protein